MIYTNLAARESGKHGLWESSNVLSTDVGKIFDCIVRDEDASNKEIEIDNGVAVCVLEATGNGLQERYARVAKKTDKIAVTGAPAEVKSALTKEQEQAYNFVNPAGKPVKTYQIQDPDVHIDIFGVASYQFTDATTEKVKVGNFVVVDGKGAWEAHEKTELDTLKTTNGFIGRIHSLAVGTYYTIVHIETVQNKEIAE